MKYCKYPSRIKGKLLIKTTGRRSLEDGCYEVAAEAALREVLHPYATYTGHGSEAHIRAADGLEKAIMGRERKTFHRQTLVWDKDTYFHIYTYKYETRTH